MTAKQPSHSSASSLQAVLNIALSLASQVILPIVKLVQLQLQLQVKRVSATFLHSVNDRLRLWLSDMSYDISLINLKYSWDIFVIKLGIFL